MSVYFIWLTILLGELAVWLGGLAPACFNPFLELVSECTLILTICRGMHGTLLSGPKGSIVRVGFDIPVNTVKWLT
jgi:hypothetical protein